MAQLDLNNKTKGTTDNKIRKLSYLLEYITRKIKESDKVTRMLVYKTKNPLARVGLEYDNKSTIQQYKVTDEEILREHIQEAGYNPEMDLKSENMLFINLISADFQVPKNSHYSMNQKITFDVNIIVPYAYMYITNGQRHLEIGAEIADMFDDKFIDNILEPEDYDRLGALQFDLVLAQNSRLARTSDQVWLNMTFEIHLVPMDRARL